METIDQYIQTFPDTTQKVLQEIRSLVKETAPEATEMISYKMPTFELGKNRLYFAANKKHIGFYAIYAPTDFEEELAPYRSTKDTIRFPLDEPMPVELIKKIVRYKLLT